MGKQERRMIMKTREKVMEEYRRADCLKRDHMWFMYIGLRTAFDEIERNGSPMPKQFIPKPRVFQYGKLDSLFPYRIPAENV
jgi:hypothetical protein